ncbi:MAG: helix-turn-helix domain-containing protein [Nitrospinota bacterium]
MDQRERENKWWTDARINLRYLRKKHGWSQFELSEKMNCSDARIKALEQGKTHFTQSSLDDLCAVFNIPIFELLTSRELYLKRVTKNDHMKVKRRLSRIYSALENLLPNFGRIYEGGIVNTFGYNSNTEKIYYETCELLNFKSVKANQDMELILKMMKGQVEKENISLAVIDLLEERVSQCIRIEDIKTKASPMYRLFSNLIISYDIHVSHMLRSPIYLKHTEEIFGVIWVGLSDIKGIDEKFLDKLTDKVNHVLTD